MFKGLTMSTFLERQQVRKQKVMKRLLRRLEPYLISAAVVAGGLLALYGLYLVMFLSRAFEVREIRVAGELVRLKSDEVILLAGVERGENLFMVDVSDVHARLHANPWIRTIAVRRQPPHSLQIFIEEYAPAAIVASERLFFIDAQGVLFKEVEAGDEKRLTVFSGIVAEGPLPGVQEAERLQRALALLEQFERSSIGDEPRLAEINYSTLLGFSLITERDPMQIVLGEEDPALRLASLERSYSAIRRHQGRVQYILATKEDRIIVKYNT